MTLPTDEKDPKQSPPPSSETQETQDPETTPDTSPSDPPGTVNITGGKCVEVKEVDGDKTVKKFVYKVEIVDTCDGEEAKRVSQHLNLLTSGLGEPVRRKRKRKAKSGDWIWQWTPTVLKYGGGVLLGWMTLRGVSNYVSGGGKGERSK
jgi:hypothetical protein